MTFWQSGKRKYRGRIYWRGFRVVDFMELMEHARSIQELDIALMIRMLDHVKVYENSVVVTAFLDGTEIE